MNHFGALVREPLTTAIRCYCPDLQAGDAGIMGMLNPRIRAVPRHQRSNTAGGGFIQPEISRRHPEENAWGCASRVGTACNCCIDLFLSECHILAI